VKIRGSNIFQPQMIRGSDNFNREIFLPENKKAK
jgi:hypothetical protein